jgi:hypothetical protein
MRRSLLHLMLLILWASPLSGAAGIPIDRILDCPWVVRLGGVESPSLITQAHLFRSGGVVLLRQVLWSSLGSIGVRRDREISLGKHRYDIVNYHSPLLLSRFPDADRLSLIRIYSPVQRVWVPIGVMVRYAGHRPWLEPSEFRFPERETHSDTLIFPVDFLIAQAAEDEYLAMRLAEVLSDPASPLAAYAGDFIDYPVFNSLVHWRTLYDFDDTLPAGTQLPAVGPIFSPTNHYTGQVVRHAVKRNLVHSGSRVLVMGAGGGGEVVAFAKMGAHVVAGDIDPWSEVSVRLGAALLGVSSRVTFVRGDLFENIPDKFSLITCVAPYPSDHASDWSDWRTFDRDFHFHRRFFNQFPSKLTRDGSTILMSVPPSIALPLPETLSIEDTNPFSTRFGTEVVNFATYEIKVKR